MQESQDSFAKGMVKSGDEHFDLTPELDEFQYRIIRPYLGRDILEIGAGHGRIARLVVRGHSNFSKFVISEPSTHFSNQLVRRIAPSEKVSLVQGQTSDLVERFQESFDTIYSVHVLEHVEDDRQFLADCLRMLKPGGRLVTLVPALQFLYSNLDKNIGHYRRYDKRMVRRLTGGLNFKIEKMFYSNFLAVFASFFFFKLRKLDYQKNESNKKQFIFLEKIYSKYFIPLIDLMERVVPVPFGLNLTFILQKSVDLHSIYPTDSNKTTTINN